MQQLYFIRHGESTANQLQICAGHTDVKLTQLGRKQAYDAVSNTDQFDLIVSSPLVRAFDTATIIAIKIGYPAENIVVSELFMERFRGKLEGRPTSLQAGLTDVEYEALGAESQQNLAIRANKAYEWLMLRSEKRILVVSHNHFGVALLSVISGTPPQNIRRLENAQMFEVELT